MGQATQPYKRSLAASVGAGMGSLLGGSGKRYYILEHKVSSKYHKAGEAQEIIVDQIEMGRDPKCQIRFDESFQTVSRRHAAIVKDGDMWKLIQLSETNSTFLNGRRIQKEWYLQTGDEIQLAVNGPKMGFIIPTGNKSTVGSIGLSRRLSLFRQQALRPYKQGLIALSLLLVLSIGGLTGWKIYGDREWKQQIAEIERERADMDEIREAQLAGLVARNDSLTSRLSSAEATNENLKSEIGTIRRQINNPPPPSSVNPTGVSNSAIEQCLPHVYFIYVDHIDVTFPDGEKMTADKGWSGTGFLLNDGRFITARHVAEGWFFFTGSGGVDDDMVALNMVANNGGKVVAHFKAISSSGDILSFTSESFICNRSTDKTVTLENGFIVKSAELDHTDWAYFNTSQSRGLKADVSKSSRLERGIRLTVLGFPLGLGANSANDINPLYGSGITTHEGLNRGVIITTDTNYEQGNSGGPVFYTTSSGDLSVIGLVSAGAGRVTGFVVPLSAIR